MSAQQATHLVLSLPLNKSSRRCIYIDTRPDNERIFVLKPATQINQEPDESENVISKSLIDHYINRPTSISHICLADFVSKYNIRGIQNETNKK